MRIPLSDPADGRGAGRPTFQLCLPRVDKSQAHARPAVEECVDTCDSCPLSPAPRQPGQQFPEHEKGKTASLDPT